MSTNYLDSLRLRRELVDIAGIKTAVYFSTNPSAKHTMLFVHGAGGDYHGLVPLARLFTKRASIVMVDLPGHGCSHVPNNDSEELILNKWPKALAEYLITTTSPSIVVGHSLGCMFINRLARYIPEASFVLINPVPSASMFFKEYSQVLSLLNFLIAPFNGLYPLAYTRGLTLLKNRTPKSISTIKWITKRTRATTHQVRFQMKFTHKAISKYKFKASELRYCQKRTIIPGLDDSIPKEEDELELKRVFPNSRVIHLRGGHLLPIESPEKVVWAIEESVL